MSFFARASISVIAISLLSFSGCDSSTFFGSSAGSGTDQSDSPVQITSPATLSSSTVGSSYSYTLQASGGSSPYSWSIVSATPNTGLWMSVTSDGVLTGTPQTSETETATVQVTDADGNNRQSTVSIPGASSGSLAVASPTTLPNATAGGGYFYPMIAEGGTPPYTWSLSSNTGTNTWYVGPMGWIEGAPTTDETDSLTLAVADSAGNSASTTISVTVNSTLALMNQDFLLNTITLPPAIDGNTYSHSLQAAGGTSPYTYAITSGSLPDGLSLSSSGVISGTPTLPGSASVVVKVTDSASNTATAGLAISVANTSQVTRPSYNTGNGFFVYNGKLYDPNGNEFRIRGSDRCHYDSGSQPGLAAAGVNAVRFFMYDIGVSGGPATSAFETVALDQHIDYNELPIITAANVAGTSSGTSGDTSATDLATTVSWWVSNESTFAPIMDKIVINIANEWGPSDSTTWESAYESAISSLRTAGYTCPLLIDTGGSGQDDADLENYSQAVFDSDPQKNVIFSLHMYGGTDNYEAAISSIAKGDPTVVTLTNTSSTHPFAPSYDGSNNSYSGLSAYELSGVEGMTQVNGEQPASQNVGGTSGSWTVTLDVDSSSWGTYTGGGTIVDYNGNYALQIARLAALSQSTGAAYVVGEFGPGRDIGPSPTNVDPGQIITASEAYGIGWMAWAWDDNDLGGGASDNDWFSMTFAGPGTYTSPSSLTEFGLEMSLNPLYGWDAVASPASAYLR